MPMPKINAGQYLIEAFHELGRADQTGMATRPLQWAEIEAYAQATQDISEPWEKRTLRKMSEAYVAWLSRGADVFALGPT